MATIARGLRKLPHFINKFKGEVSFKNWKYFLASRTLKKVMAQKSSKKKLKSRKVTHRDLGTMGLIFKKNNQTVLGQ
jgi:hypothetical protein